MVSHFRIKEDDDAKKFTFLLKELNLLLDRYLISR